MKMKSCIKNQKEQKGIILIIVLWIVFVLVSMAVAFSNSMLLEYKAADNSLANLEAIQTVESAAKYIKFILSNLEEKGEIPDTELYLAEDVEVSNGTFWLIGRDNDSDSYDLASYSLIDESSKLNLNTAELEMLELLPDMTTELAGAIVDWRDTDSEVNYEGAESDTYLPTYNCKNSNFETIEEIHLVNGADWDILYGEDTNMNGLLDANENDGDETEPDDNSDGILDPGIMEYLTVYSREPNNQSDGNSRVNINSRQTQQLIRIIDETLGQGRGSELVSGSGTQNYSSILEFYYRSGMTVEEFSQIEDKITVSDGDYIEGRVNVNTASETVLSCIPGLGTGNASDLIANRQGKTTDELSSITWVTEVLSEEDAMLAGPYITTKSYQFSVDISAVGHNGRGFYRALFVFDTTGDEPVILYRRDLTRLGWSLGSDVREKLDSMRVKES